MKDCSDILLWGHNISITGLYIPNDEDSDAFTEPSR